MVKMGGRQSLTMFDGVNNDVVAMTNTNKNFTGTKLDSEHA